MGNTTSSDSYILNRRSFLILKKEIDLFIEDYFSKIIFAPKGVSPYITQSWLNYTEINEHHHPHHHQNAYLSGILYIAADKDHDNVTFGRNDYNQISISPTKGNVTMKKGKNSRISLSFNVFLKGNLGEVDNLNELKL